jgi:hypothetical protein
MADHDSLPELELANVRTREHIEDTVARIRHKTNVPERWRLFVARSRQQLHRDPTPLVAMMVTGAAGVAAIVVGVRTRRNRDMHLATTGRDPVLLPAFKPVKTKKDGTSKGVPAFSRVPDKNNPVPTKKSIKKDRKRAQKRQQKAFKQLGRIGR